MVLHLVRDLRRCWWCSGSSGGYERVCPVLIQHHALHCHNRLVYLSTGLLLWISPGCCCLLRPQLGVQPCRFYEQDCILPCNLAGGQELNPCTWNEVKKGLD